MKPVRIKFHLTFTLSNSLTVVQVQIIPHYFDSVLYLVQPGQKQYAMSKNSLNLSTKKFNLCVQVVMFALVKTSKKKNHQLGLGHQYLLKSISLPMLPTFGAVQISISEMPPELNYLFYQPEKVIQSLPLCGFLQ